MAWRSDRRQNQTKFGGARRDRTDDLLLAKQALSQLSYGPDGRPACRAYAREKRAKLVGPGRVELPTSRLSGVRSNHLSYGPPFRKDAGFPMPEAGGADRSGEAGSGLRPRRKRNEDGGVPPNGPVISGPESKKSNSRSPAPGCPGAGSHLKDYP